VTLTGVGGVGKTRLALAVAAHLQADFADGVVFVDLAPLRTATLIAATIARALGVAESGARPLLESLHRALEQRDLLLILDNFEHVADAAPLVAALVARHEGLRVLVTSRERLRLHGEQEFPVSPLALPAPQQHADSASLATNPAVALFVQRAQAVQPDFALTAANAAAVAAVCTRLDGLPLALELAAARIKVLSPAALLARLQRRLPLLVTGPCNVPDRQRTLRATMDWSYALLQPAERTLFRRLAVFVDGCTLEAVENVSAALDGAIGSYEVLEGLGSLIDKSLLVQREQEGGEVRFGLLETVREYAEERLEASREAPVARRQHALYYLALAETAEPALWQGEQARWLRRLEREHGNVGAALQWAQQHREGELGLRLAASLQRYWQVRGHWGEARLRLGGLLEGEASHAVPLPIRVKALQTAALFAARQHDYTERRRLLEERLALCQRLGDDLGSAKTRLSLLEFDATGVPRMTFGPEGMVLGEQIVRMARADGDIPGVLDTLMELANAAHLQCDYDRARAWWDEALRLSRERDDTYSIAVIALHLGMGAFQRGDYERAIPFMEESLARSRQLGGREMSAWVLNELAECAREQGDEERARLWAGTSRDLWRDLGDPLGLAISQHILGKVDEGRGHHASACVSYQQSMHLFQQTKGDRSVAGVAQVQVSLANLMQDQGDDGPAGTLYRDSLTLYQAMGRTQGLATCLEGVACWLSLRDHAVPAMRLFGAATGIREELATPLPRSERPRQERWTAAMRTALGDDAYEAAYAAGRALRWDQAVTLALETLAAVAPAP
jgi:predicted ATPase